MQIPFTMAESSESKPVARASKPVSEALLNEKVSSAMPVFIDFESTSALFPKRFARLFLTFPVIMVTN